MMDDVILNKVESIERCIRQIRVYDAIVSHSSFTEDYLTQDAILLNLLRAVELSLDIANHIVRVKKLGIPKDSRESVGQLVESGIIQKETGDLLKAMVGFRNIAIHEYRKIDHAILRSVLDTHLDDFLRFTSEVLQSEC